MPNYLKLPDGTYYTVPDGVDPDMAVAMAKDKYPDAFKVNNSEHILFRCGDKYKTSDDSSTAAKLQGEGCTQITGIQQSTSLPATTSRPVALQSTSKLQDTDLGSAAGTALLQTAGGFAVASLLFWVLARHLWKKLRRTPHELGLWVGSWIGCLSVAQSVGRLIGNLLYKNPEKINWSESLIEIPVLFVVYFVAGYVLGWLFRKVKPLASPVQTVVPNIPTSAPQARPLTNSRPLHSGANISSTKLEEKGWLEWFSLGVSYEDAGHIGKAIDAFREALRINQDHFESWFNLGILYIKIGPFDKAINALEHAVRIDPNNAGAWDSLGTAHGSAGQFSKAIVAFKNAVRISPGDLNAWNNLALTYVAIGDEENAAKCFDKAQTTPIGAPPPEENLPQGKLDLNDAAMDDEALYEQALNELSTSKKPGLWAMALAQTANGGSADGTYIALRVEQLKHEYAQQKQTPKNQGVVAVPEHIDHPQSPVNQLPEIARASRLRRLEMAFNTSVESAHRGLDTCEPLAKHYKTLARFRSPVDARKLVWLIDYEILEPGEDPNFPDSYLVRRSAGDEPIAFFKDEREFVDWALTSFVVRMPEAGGYI